MTLGPGLLSTTAVDAIIADPIYATALTDFISGVIEWKHKNLSDVKMAIRSSLRSQQARRCVYCRRIILQERKNTTEDIEHFLDKSKKAYRKWAFNSRNLTISCHPCNMQKTTKDMGDAAIAAMKNYPQNTSNFTWLHPYYDNFHDNIDVIPGWEYIIKPKAPQHDRAQRLIAQCKLVEVKNIEKYKQDILTELEKKIVDQGQALEDGNLQLVGNIRAELADLIADAKFNI